MITIPAELGVRDGGVAGDVEGDGESGGVIRFNDRIAYAKCLWHRRQ